jgi:hypothetical protein
MCFLCAMVAGWVVVVVVIVIVVVLLNFSCPALNWPTLLSVPPVGWIDVLPQLRQSPHDDNSIFDFKWLQWPSCANVDGDEDLQ